MSIRLRLMLWHSTIFATGLVAFAIIVWLATGGALRADLDSWLSRQADGLGQFLLMETHGTDQASVVEEAREFSTGLPKGSGIQLFNRHGGLLFVRPEAPIQDLSNTSPTTVIHNEAALRTLSRRITIGNNEYHYVLWRTLEDTDTALNDLERILILLTPAFLLLSAAGGWWLSRHALRQVDEITEAARRISLTDLSLSLPVPSNRDELQRLCQAWNEMLGRLRSAASRLTQFTADAAHELRAPVTVIRTTAELALRHKRDPLEYQDALAKIREESEEMSRMLEDLMELSRTDAGQSRLDFGSLDLRDLFSEIRPLVEALAAQKGIEFSLQLPPEGLPVVGDRTLLRRLLLVLLDNAFKFTPSLGRVEVRAAQRPEHVTLEIQDSGIGISEQDLPRIFDRFYQADGSRSGGGSGLGLSIAQWIVHDHHGLIEVSSKLEQGSLFRIILPNRY